MKKSLILLLFLSGCASTANLAEETEGFQFVEYELRVTSSETCDDQKFASDCTYKKNNFGYVPTGKILRLEKVGE